MGEVIKLSIVIPTDVYDSEGNLTKIEFHDKEGSHVIDAMWDPNDPQDSEHRVKFREWAYRLVEQKGYKIPK